MNFLKTGIFILFFALYLSVFRAWFYPGVITGGDMWYFFPSMFDNHSFLPSEWAFFAGNGFGGSSIPFMAVNFFMSIPFFVGKTFGLSWDILVRFFVLFPFLICVTLFPFLLFRKLFSNNYFALLSSLIFSLNTYILMLVSGGLVVIGIGYSLIPLTFLIVINIFEKKKDIFFQALLLGLITGLQSILDVRVTYIAFIGITIFFIVRMLNEKSLRDIAAKFFCIFIIPVITALLLNAFWVLPSLLYGSNALNELGGNYTTVESVRFFSFAKFENAISMLHPNWPENIFGKTYFLRPEFLIFPMLAFLSLLFIKRDNRKVILPFVLVGLAGIFLAKGSNEPFGFIYLFLFENIPGFVFYRDPTKWYMLIALSFSVLIPFSLYHVSLRLGRHGYLVSVLFMTYLLITISPALLGRLPGTMQTSNVPEEYREFEKFMVKQEPGRVMWIPAPSRFSYFTEKHPAISASRYFNMSTPSAIAASLTDAGINELSKRGVGYIAVPYDNRGELFLKDREYYHPEYLETVKVIESNPTLSPLGEFGKLKLYKFDIETNGLNLQKKESKNNVYNWGSTISMLSFFLTFVMLAAIKIKR